MSSSTSCGTIIRSRTYSKFAGARRPNRVRETLKAVFRTARRCAGLRDDTGATSRVRRSYSRYRRKGRSRGPDCLRRLQCLESEVEAAIELGLLGDGARQLGLHGGALAAREAAPAQLGPQLL